MRSQFTFHILTKSPEDSPTARSSHDTTGGVGVWEGETVFPVGHYPGRGIGLIKDPATVNQSMIMITLGGCPHWV